MPRSTLHRALLCGTLLLFVLFALRGVRRGLRAGGNDFTIYYDSARQVLEGGDPLSIPGSIYLPSFDVLLAPLALLPYAAALWVWQAVCLAALLWGWKRCLELVGPALERRPWVSWAALLAVARLADSNFAYGQVNTLTFALVAETGFRLREHRHGASAAALGLGAALKIVPGALCLWLFLRGAWRAALLSVLAAALWILVPTFAVLGNERAVDSFARWGRDVLAPAVHGGTRLFEAREYAPGQSLAAACYRLLSATPSTSRGQEGPRANLLDLSVDTTHGIVLALSAVHLCLWVVLALRARPRPGSGTRPGREGDRHGERDMFLLALAVTMVLVLAPMVHKAHLVWLLLPYSALMCFPSRLPGRTRTARDIFFWVSVGLMGLSAPALLGDRLASWLLERNILFLGLECALIAVGLELWGLGRNGPSLEHPPSDTPERPPEAARPHASEEVRRTQVDRLPALALGRGPGGAPADAERGLHPR
jgi:hypothetical protein